MKNYDYLVVGSGLFGAVFSYYALKSGKSVLVLEKRPHIGGNVYTELIEDINVHRYGAHIFHTSDKYVWDFINSFAEFNNYVNSPIANYKGELYNLPFNMNTFYRLWATTTPAEAQRKIADEVKKANVKEPKNLEEQAISLVGKEFYEKLIKGYTEKQWGRDCRSLPAFIIKRLPCRFIFDNNYFNDRYQGIPIGGYTKIIEKMLDGAGVKTNIDYFDFIKNPFATSKKTVFTGAIDEFFGFKYGHLQYRTVRFDTKILDTPNFQGVAVMNFTDRETPYTRCIEHKHFEYGTQPKTVVSYEYSQEWQEGSEPYYPVNDEKNNALYEKYSSLAASEKNVIFGGRLGQYKYYDMDKVILSAFSYAEKEGLK